MLNLVLNKSKDAPLQVLFLGAHCDDIEIGCGGTALTLTEWHANVLAHWVVLSSDEQRALEARRSASSFLRRAKTTDIVVESFRDGYFPYKGAPIKDYFEELKTRLSPDLIFTHHRDDWHQDHRLVCELTWNTWRDHLILEYEVPKYDPDSGSPNLFVNLRDDVAESKVEYLLESFPSQGSRPWFTRDLFLGMMRFRGIQGRADRYAEAFYCRKFVIGRP